MGSDEAEPKWKEDVAAHGRKESTLLVATQRWSVPQGDEPQVQWSTEAAGSPSQSRSRASTAVANHRRPLMGPNGRVKEAGATYQWVRMGQPKPGG